jgi:hypothetical protein
MPTISDTRDNDEQGLTTVESGLASFSPKDGEVYVRTTACQHS